MEGSVMPDITMCNNSLCPISKQCYRHEAILSEWQSMATFQYTTGASGVICDKFMRIYRYETCGDTRKDNNHE